MAYNIGSRYHKLYVYTLTGIGRCLGHSSGTIIAWFTSLTVNTVSVVPTIDTHSSSFVVSIYIQTSLFLRHLFTVVAVYCMVVAVTGYESNTVTHRNRLSCKSELRHVPFYGLIWLIYTCNVKLNKSTLLQTCGPRIPDQNWNKKVFVFVEGGKLEYMYQKKNPWSKDENQQKTQPTNRCMTPGQNRTV